MIKQYEMKDRIIKLLAAVCFIAGSVMVLGAMEKSSFVEGVIGLCVFALLIPISRAKVFDRR